MGAVFYLGAGWPGYPRHPPSTWAMQLVNSICPVLSTYFSVRAPQPAKAKKKDFHALLHNSNISSSTDDHRIPR